MLAVVKVINDYPSWGGMSPDQTVMISTKKGVRFNTLKVNVDIIDVVIYTKHTVEGKVVRVTAFASIKLTGRTKTSLDIQFQSKAVFVSETGNLVKSFPSGKKLSGWSR